MARRYTQEQQQFLQQMIPGRSHKDTAELFTAKFEIPMTASCVKSYANRRKIHSERFYLTDEQIAFIKANGAGNDDKTLTELFNSNFGTDCTVKKISRLRYKYGAPSGLKTRVPNSGQFQKGRTPFNKGLKQQDYTSAEAIERSTATRFKKGNIPINHREVGSTRINVDGYVEIKTAEPNIWRQLHRVNWEKAYGPLQQGDMLIFLDGDKTNCSVENLALIDRSTNARLNQGHLRFKHPEVTKVAVNLGRLIAASHKHKRRKTDTGGGEDK